MPPDVVAECKRRGYTRQQTLAVLTLAIDEHWTSIPPGFFDQLDALQHPTINHWYNLAQLRGQPAFLWQAYEARLYVHIHEAEDIYDGKDVPVTIFGPDISNNNGVVDLDRLKAEGFDFVFAKVSEGAGFKDSFWPGTRDWAHRIGLIIAGYHYVKTDDPQRQADNFVAQLGGESIPAMLDFEANSGGIANFWAVKNAIEARGVRVALSYIPRWYWQQIGSPDISTVPGLIQSSYVNGAGTASGLYPGDTSSFWSGFGGRAVDILQFTDKATIAGKSLDANAFRGTPDQLRALLGGDDWQPVMDELLGIG